VGEVADASSLREPMLRILRRIGWWGMANAEFKLDPRDGCLRLMEINGRCFLMQGLALAAGINYPYIAWREAVLGEHARIEPRDWDGVWLNAIDDLYHMLLFRRLEGLSLRQYMAPWTRPKVFAIWSRNDWKPFLMHCAFGLRKAARMAFKSEYRTAVLEQVQPVHPGAITRSCDLGVSRSQDE
jgi:predicted ATP-grasp superfamily ATP-dependent carboligase